MASIQIVPAHPNSSSSNDRLTCLDYLHTRLVRKVLRELRVIPNTLRILKRLLLNIHQPKLLTNS